MKLETIIIGISLLLIFNMDSDLRQFHYFVDPVVWLSVFLGFELTGQFNANYEKYLVVFTLCCWLRIGEVLLLSWYLSRNVTTSQILFSVLVALVVSCVITLVDESKLGRG